VPSRPRLKSSKRRGKPPKSTAVRAISVECWALPNETDLARLDRVVAVLLERLCGAGVTVPDNFRRLEVCAEPQHERCFTYSFGTRIIHLSTREGTGGRITLVVRCGGGFLDFVEFVRRNGSLEQLRLQRTLEADVGSQHVSLATVLVQGRRQVKQTPR